MLYRKLGEALSLIYKASSPYFPEINDISIELKFLESNTSLSAKSILNLANILKLAYDLKNYFNNDFIDNYNYPVLSELFTNLYSNKDIIDTVFLSIIDENTIDDKASKDLYNIRKQKKKIEQDIRSNLSNLIHSSSYSKYIQENIVTIRNDRFVIPVKEEYRSQIKGFIHDVSNAGSTVFIEPLSVFELNNELNKLKNMEELEINNILQNLTNLFFPYVSELQFDIELIGKLDFIFAKAKYSKNINGITPKINLSKSFSLINAKHPLIDENKVVPISIELGQNFSTLLITGPNTGGKTVCLKTVGLLICMACSGLNIPCSQNSSIYVFDNIFTDIGDDQSIIDSLSTFSSHMLNIIGILKNINKNSLILMDELSSGTDPLEGANLAIAILEHLDNMDCLTIATTHYQELKQYALATKNFENASVEFDISTLSPTYKLLIGIAGKSNAFEISKKLGLDDSIIFRAKELLSTDQINIEDLLKSIYDDKVLIEQEKLELKTELSKISTLRKTLEVDNLNLSNKKQEIINNAKVEARNILLDAKEESSEIIKSIREKNNFTNIKEIEDLRNKLNISIKKHSSNTSNTTSSNNLSNEDLKINNKVFIPSLNQEGTIISNVSKSNEVQIQVGNIKMNLNISNLEKSRKNLENIKKDFKNSTSHVHISKIQNIKTEINVIGFNVEEAIYVIDKFLDDCSLSRLETCRIVHGKGTGKLRTGIHQFLKSHPQVKSYRIGTFGEGEMGVTVVEIK